VSDEKRTAISGKLIAEFIVATTTLALAAAAYLKPETSARKSYDVLAHVVEDQSKALTQNHDDIVALRNYLDGYTKSQAEHAVAYQITSAVPPTPGAAAPAPKTIVKIKRVDPPPPVPSASPKPLTYEAKSYKSVTGAEDIK